MARLVRLAQWRPVSTKVVRSISDLIRHGYDLDVECRCGHKATLDAHQVHRVFSERRWYMGLNDGFSMGSPYSRFRCSKCGGRPAQIGPRMR